MLSQLLAFFLAFTLAKPGYQYQFPRDHYSHPEFRTEWWYWTGNLQDAQGRRFGFELTFFRQAVGDQPRAPRNAWDPTDLYLAHLALSDVATGKFHHEERVSRAGPGLAGADQNRAAIWNGNWRAGLNGLEAITEEFHLRLNFSSSKPPVIHGVNGVSQKAAGEGRASHYVSFSRIDARGSLVLNGQTFELTGTAWMDHEFFTHQLEAEQAGWDWMSIQLADRTELMLFHLRRRDGSIDPHSAGTYIDATGRTRHLTARDFTLTPTGRRYNKYPIAWRIEVPSLGLRLNADTPMENQELGGSSAFSPKYWEGAMDFRGTRAGAPIGGQGYLEMTGYAGPPPKL
ncbi:MAG: carotenoid 1,2-hydratase [Bryobacterales bacterium]|nr:carotenoid 1,2-hydratase [Bryobacterales bacterium]